MNHSIFSRTGVCILKGNQGIWTLIHKHKNAESNAGTCRKKTIHTINVPNDDIGKMVKAKQLQFDKQWQWFMPMQWNHKVDF